MTLIALAGDHTTTTALALAASWPDHRPDGDRGDLAGNPAGRDLVVVEADPRGGSLAAWLDTPVSPSLSSVVTALHHSSSDEGPGTIWATVDRMVRRSNSGVRFVPTPFRAGEARGAVAEADRVLFGALAEIEHTVALADLGAVDPLRVPAAASRADFVLIVHRQERASAAAATVRLERLAETVEAVRSANTQVGLAVVGDTPFDVDEVATFAAPGVPAWRLADDPLAAAVFAGRAGVSPRRLGRLPLVRSASRIAEHLATVGGIRPVSTEADTATRTEREVVR